jgi:hypothetical protein
MGHRVKKSEVRGQTTEDRGQNFGLRIADCGLMKGAREQKTKSFPCALSLEPYDPMNSDS